uniref:Transcriptional corepressor LEUNIG-like isoform X2 n=1 Tax=Cicer arietinum TaxID=3827 RepID=A0A1S3EI40_CICAR|nr:transcriptional corepressor LEUNIG-like isoform X2 [Cicer arietinum]
MDSNNNDPHDPDADAMFRLYLHDYLIKKGMHNTAEIFMNEAEVHKIPTDKNFLDTVLDSPDGFLHDWWSIFYDVFRSRQGRHQQSQPEFSSKVPKMIHAARNSSPFRIPQMPMNEQRSQQFQANPSFNNIMAQPTGCLISPRLYNKEQLGNIDPRLLALIGANNPNFMAGTSSNNPSQDMGKQVQKQAFKENGIGMRVGFTSRGPQKAMLPLERPHETNNYDAPNVVPTNGLPLNDPRLTSLLQIPNYPQQCQVLNTQNQDAILTQALASAPNNQPFTAPGNSSKCNSQYPEIPKTESSNKDKEMMGQTVRAGEPQCKQDQQMQSQNIDKGRKRKVRASLRPEECVRDCVDAADGKPADENVESYLSIENGNADHRTLPFSNLKRISATNSRNENKGFSFQEVGTLHSCKSKVLSSHFSSNGEVLASAGHDKKIFIWNMETFECVSTEETHSLLITDVRFRPGSTIFATSSFDRSVRLWDTTRPAKSLLKLTGHSEQVMSLDFHPRKVDLLCSCDSNDIIRVWNVNQCACLHVIKGGSKQVRFQPLYGKLLATATGNNVKIFDIETNSLLYHLQGHDKDVLSICWDRSGKYIASVSEDSARVWSDGECISELPSNGNKFQSCIFHPAYCNLLVIGGYQSLEFWSPTESSRTLSIIAHRGLIAGLADSPEDELIASASHDHVVKLWK